MRRVTILYCLEHRCFRIPVARHTNLKHYTLQPFKDVPVPGPIVRSYFFAKGRQSAKGARY